MIFVALNEAAECGELLLGDGGLCRFHLRRDGVVVIREVIVLPHKRRQGVGRSLIEEVQRRHPLATLRASCPAKYEANKFWPALGFTSPNKVEDGGLIVWERPSSTVPTGIPPSLAPQ